MTRQKVTDPQLLAKLGSSTRQKVTDPNLLAKLNADEPIENIPEQEGVSSWLPRDILIGLSNLGHNTLNTPYNLAKSFEQIGQGLENSINKTLPMEKYVGQNRLPNNKSYLQQMVESFNQQHNVPEEIKNPNWDKSWAEKIPHQEEYDYAKALGQQGEGSLLDNIIQKGVEYAPEIAGGVKLLSELPITKYPGVKALKKVKTEIAKREVGNLQIPEHIVKDIKKNKFLRDTQANRNLLKRVEEGGYQDLFDLQSDLGKLERSYTRDPFSASNRHFGKDIGETRQDLLSAMRDQLSNLGHQDLAELLSHGQNLYRQYMKFRPYRNAAAGIGLVNMGIPGYKLIKKMMNP